MRPRLRQLFVHSGGCLAGVAGSSVCSAHTLHLCRFLNSDPRSSICWIVSSLFLIFANSSLLCLLAPTFGASVFALLLGPALSRLDLPAAGRATSRLSSGVQRVAVEALLVGSHKLFSTSGMMLGLVLIC